MTHLHIKQQTAVDARPETDRLIRHQARRLLSALNITDCPRAVDKLLHMTYTAFELATPWIELPSIDHKPPDKPTAA